MLVKKKILSSLLAVGVSSLCVMAHAETYVPSDLTIVNNTKSYTTSIINGGLCSWPTLGEIGRTKPGDTSVIDKDIVKRACVLNTVNCKADVYLSGDCSGTKIATVTFNISSGVTSVAMNTTAYLITSVGFTIYLNPVAH